MNNNAIQSLPYAKRNPLPTNKYAWKQEKKNKTIKMQIVHRNNKAKNKAHN